MNNKLMLIALLPVFLSSKMQAQVGIGTTTPDSSAILHLNDPKKGLLLTSIALTSATDALTIPSPATGLLIWNNGSGGFIPAGLYFWNNSKWNSLSGGASSFSNTTSGWSTSGDNLGNYGGAGTNLSLGTSQFDDLIFKVNSSFAGRLGTNGNVVFGPSSSAFQNGVALGTNSTTTANESTAIGANSYVSGQQSVALGYNSRTTKNESAAVGTNSSASGFQSIALGYNSKTNSNGETALGHNAQTNGENSTALGSGSKAIGLKSVASGFNSQSTGENSLALGVGSLSSGLNSAALGSYSQSTAENAVAVGISSISTAHNATAIGYGASASQVNSVILGNSVANVGIGTSTPNINTKVDVYGQYKLGEKGSIQKNQISFEVYTGGANTLNAGETTVFDISVPAGFEPSTTRATITVTPAPDFVGNTTLAISNARMTSVSSVKINLTNLTNSPTTLTHGHFYVIINEF
nr:hypothetical protein [uncultured Chryseobacterium sp.]